MKNSSCVFITVIALIVSQAQAQDPLYVPDQLKPWIKWVTEGIPDFECANVKGARACLWPGKLSLDLSADGGRFEYQISLDARSEVSLPSTKDSRPSNVTVVSSGKTVPAAVLFRDGRVLVPLDKGLHNISGTFAWNSIPRSISVPADSALLELSVDGRRIPFPRMSNTGEVWLQEEEPSKKEEQDSVKVEVFRKLSDGVPFRISNLLLIRAAGKVRTWDAGKTLPADSVPIQAAGGLPWQFGPDFSLSLQLRPGTHTVMIESVLPSPPASLTPPIVQADGWPDREIWLWNADDAFRSTEITGGTPIDPARANVPPQFQGLPAFVLLPDQSLAFTEKRRGQASPAPNLLTLNRTFWLSLDGDFFSVQDQINGTMSQGWRIDAHEDLVPDRIEVNGTPQVITKNRSGNAGVEVRHQRVNVQAESRVERKGAINAAGWAFDPQSLFINLKLPPGWKLLEASGPDDVSDSWLSSWNLLDIFLTMLIAVLAYHLLGVRVGMISALALVLSHGEEGLPILLWFHLLAGLALLRFTNPEKAPNLHGFLRWYFLASLVMALLVISAFTFNQLTLVMFPQLPPGFNAAWEMLRGRLNLLREISSHGRSCSLHSGE